MDLHFDSELAETIAGVLADAEYKLMLWATTFAVILKKSLHEVRAVPYARMISTSPCLLRILPDTRGIFKHCAKAIGGAIFAGKEGEAGVLRALKPVQPSRDGSLVNYG